MKRLWALLLLAACASEPKEAPSVLETSLLRNPTAPLASQADASYERLLGDWYVRQVASPNPVLYETIQFGDDHNDVEGVSICVSFDCTRYDLVSNGQGRFGIADTTLFNDLEVDQLWVLWMDFDDRTVVIGDPDGRFVWIVDRKQTGGADRLAAARDILDWYGYDLTKLREITSWL